MAVGRATLLLSLRDVWPNAGVWRGRSLALPTCLRLMSHACVGLVVSIAMSRVFATIEGHDPSPCLSTDGKGLLRMPFI